MHGNALSLTTGQQDVFRANLSRYLTGLEEKKLPLRQDLPAVFRLPDR